MTSRLKCKTGDIEAEDAASYACDCCLKNPLIFDHLPSFNHRDYAS